MKLTDVRGRLPSTIYIDAQSSDHLQDVNCLEIAPRRVRIMNVLLDTRPTQYYTGSIIPMPGLTTYTDWLDTRQ